MSDAVIVGAGPNGLSAGIVLAQAGLSVKILEANDEPGGGARSGELTVPGFVHDLGSAVHPMAVASPFIGSLPLAQYGLEWIIPPAAVAHPFDDGRAVTLERSVEETARQLEVDAAGYQALMAPLVRNWRATLGEVLGPLHVPRQPVALATFGVRGFMAATWLAKLLFRKQRARALLAGIAAHTTLPLNQPPSAAFALVLGLAGHAVGWPIPRGGAGSISRALAAHFQSLGGTIVCDRRVQSLSDVPAARLTLLDLTPRQILAIAGDRLPAMYRSQLERFTYGLGTFKMDWALDAPIPWKADACYRSATVHLGGTMEEIAGATEESWRGEAPNKPFVILSQPTLFDPSRAPEGKHVAWAYGHLPNGSEADLSAAIEGQIDRFAPGFRDRIVARHVTSPAQLEAMNANLVGGDLGGGEVNLAQLFTRPVARLNPYATPLRGVFICSSSTPPGGGVHGMCGYYAARAALRSLRI